MTELILSALTAAVLVVGGFAAKALDKVARQLEGMEIVKVILVKNKLVNLIVKPAK